MDKSVVSAKAVAAKRKKTKVNVPKGFKPALRHKPRKKTMHITTSVGDRQQINWEMHIKKQLIKYQSDSMALILMSISN